MRTHLLSSLIYVFFSPIQFFTYFFKQLSIYFDFNAIHKLPKLPEFDTLCFAGKNNIKALQVSERLSLFS